MATTTVKKVSLPTKADEISHLREFVASLPTYSYLHSALSPFVEEFASDIYSDLVPTVRQSWDSRIEAEKETKAAAATLAGLQAQIKAAKTEVADQVRSLHAVKARLKDLRGTLDAFIYSVDRTSGDIASNL
jgi:septal ring factor EnvC (AmiA/AmiB activator)